MNETLLELSILGINHAPLIALIIIIIMVIGWIAYRYRIWKDNKKEKLKNA